ncbi:hypothetical protein [Veillonella montpellierensis]|uniref:hypothetical protein n=1 Tax=Veillonella montpellierensis TaxID=187328 RepID=UPI00068B841B|nr:hypothetical protein [Veillonella montpellierensis]
MDIVSLVASNPLVAQNATVQELLANPTLAVIAVIVVIALLIKIAFYTIKRIVLNVAVGYLFYLGVNHFSHTTVDMSFLSWLLTAPLGPLPVIVTWLQHNF